MSVPQMAAPPCAQTSHNDRARVQRFYDDVWTRYVPEPEPTRAHLETLLPKERIREARVLDAGCGTGVFSACMARLGARHVTGLDISPGALSTAKKLIRGLPANLARGSLEALPFPSRPQS